MPPLPGQADRSARPGLLAVLVRHDPHLLDPSPVLLTEVAVTPEGQEHAWSSWKRGFRRSDSCLNRGVALRSISATGMGTSTRGGYISSCIIDASFRLRA